MDRIIVKLLWQHFKITGFGVLQKDSKKESSSVVVDRPIETLGEQFFITKFVTKRTSFVIGKTMVVKIMVKQWFTNLL